MKGKLFFLLFIFFLAYLVGREWWWRGPDLSAAEHTVVIASGISVEAIADQLKEADIIGSPFLFKMYTALAGKSTKLQAGEFSLQEGTSISRVVAILGDAKANEITLTFPEGWTIKDMGVYMEEQGVVTRAAWEMAARQDLEGYLFPDTYRFLKGVSAEEVVAKMRETFTKKAIEGLLDRSEEQGLSLHEALTLASIVEAEVRSFEDRKLVADIFLRRLDIGMPLQADSTVNYVTGKDTPSISYADRDIDSPYNTYKYRGLPPGPIGNPGAEAIRALLEHASNPYFFFLTDAEGKVYYAKTLEEHNVNKARYLK